MATSISNEGTNWYTTSVRKRYVLAVLTIIYVFNLIDRQILSILQQPIKEELGLTDTQLGLLTGFAFATFYVVAGVPIARLADHKSRRNIVALAVGTWSLMTALCGLAQNYIQLFAARVGVGIGEAGCSPPAHSMISDMYPAERRGSALSIYNSGIYLGVLFGFLLGGWLNQIIGWRFTLMAVGIPGILLAILVRATVREPVRGASERNSTHNENLPPFKSVLAFLWAKKSVRYIAIGSGLSAFCAYSVMNWMAPYIIRIYGMSTAELGLWLALSIGVFGGVGTVGSGFLADNLGTRDKRWYMWLPAFAMLLSAPFYVATFNMTGAYSTLIILCIPICLSNVFASPSICMIHGVAEQKMRATGSALYFLVANFVGLGLGPLFIGIASDSLAEFYGNESLRYAMLYVIPPVSLIAGLFFLRGSKYLREELID